MQTVSPNHFRCTNHTTCHSLAMGWNKADIRAGYAQSFILAIMKYILFTWKSTVSSFSYDFSQQMFFGSISLHKYVFFQFTSAKPQLFVLQRKMSSIRDNLCFSRLKCNLCNMIVYDGEAIKPLWTICFHYKTSQKNKEIPAYWWWRHCNGYPHRMPHQK